MIERIDIDVFLQPLGNNNGGMSKPIHILGSNGREYILKNQHVYNEEKKAWEIWDCMFLQEVLVHKIAKYLDISIPDCAIASVDSAFISQDPTLRFNYRYVPGYHFASKLIEGVENNLIDGFQQLIQLGKRYAKTSWTTFFSNIVNKDDIPKIIVLDILTGNFDRFGNIGNLIVASNNGDRLLYCIDHGHCFFGSNWGNMNKRNMLLHVSANQPYINAWINILMNTTGKQVPMGGLGDIFRALDQYIDVSDPNNHCFHDVVLAAESIGDGLIDDWFRDIPNEWFVEQKVQIATYKKFLLEQKNLLRTFLNILAGNGAFQSYIGGALTWNAKLTGTP